MWFMVDLKMINFVDLAIKDLLPSSLLSDQNIVALCDAIQPQFSEVTQAIAQALFLPNINNLSGNILDHLAWWFNLDGDEGWTLATTDEQKRQLIVNAIEIQRYKGTKYGVVKALEPLGLVTSIEEWFEYGGNPYYFRLTIDGMQNYTPDKIDLLDRYVLKNKNVRSWVTTLVNIDFKDKLRYASGLIESQIVNLMPL
jgi:phage tail P2-like protein